MSPRPDFVFSYWAFVWYLLYIGGVVTANPKLALILALTANVFQLFLMRDPIRILLFLFFQFFIKILPLYTLRHLPIGGPGPTMVVFLIYMAWLSLNNIDVYTVYTTERKTPLSDWLLRYFSKS